MWKQEVSIKINKERETARVSLEKVVQAVPSKDCFLAEATAPRGYCEDKPSVSPREWAQTAAIGVALRNAGFGLQFAIAGEDFPENAPEALPESPAPEEYTVEEPAPKELTPEEKLEQASA